MNQAFFQISLVAAFIAGMVALFAPCCISYLFPAYIGNVFKERKRVLLMTFIYSLGIFVVMMPIVLGAQFLSSFFMNFHDNTYIWGGLFMILVGFFTFLGIKFPMPRFRSSKKSNQKNGKPDVVSTFMLGVVSGITSACCAPVLIGVMALSSFSVSTAGALMIGFAYVMGMVTPLYLSSFFIKNKNLLNSPWLKKKAMVLNLFGEKRPIFMSNVVGGGIFILTGVLMIGLTKAGLLSMPTGDDSITKAIGQVAITVTNFTDNIPGINLVFIGLAVLVIHKVVKEVRKDSDGNGDERSSDEKKNDGKNKKDDCCD